MKKLFLKKANLASDDGKEFTLEYTVLVEEISTANGGILEGYGIRIDKKIGNSLVEYAEFPNITMKALEIERLFMLLSEGTVTPIALQEILEDYLENTCQLTCGCEV